jgi:hypothetical protein
MHLWTRVVAAGCCFTSGVSCAFLVAGIAIFVCLCRCIAACVTAELIAVVSGNRYFVSVREAK